jgi:putative copper export protein
VAPDLALTVFTRWAGLVALAALVGGLVMATAVLPTGPTLWRRTAAWTRASAVLLVVASAGELLLRARTMTGGGFADALRGAPVVLARTHFGLVWAVRAGALVVLLALIGRPSRAARTAACILALGVALTATLVGHAADRGDLSLPVLIDWLHVVSATTWTGGLFCLAVIVLPGAVRWPGEQLAVMLRRFTRLAAWSIGLVVATGVYNACLQVGSLLVLATTTYGRILLVKIVLVAAIACLGGANRAALGAPTVTRSRYVVWEAALALAVFGCTAMLTEAAPARHAAHARIGGPPPSHRLLRRLRSAD